MVGGHQVARKIRSLYFRRSNDRINSRAGRSLQSAPSSWKIRKNVVRNCTERMTTEIVVIVLDRDNTLMFYHIKRAGQTKLPQISKELEVSGRVTHDRILRSKSKEVA